MDHNRKPILMVAFHRYLHRLKGPWHRQASLAFLAIVIAHWAEHLLQALQVYVLHWPREISRGALGYVFPWLVSSEWLHYIYAIIMLLGLLVLRPAYQDRARFWWDTALIIQVWHHFEHGLLLGQALAGHNLFGSPVPTSILQLFIPRIELHLFYNVVVFVPMFIAMIDHIFSSHKHMPVCDCSSLARWAVSPTSVTYDR